MRGGRCMHCGCVPVARSAAQNGAPAMSTPNPPGYTGFKSSEPPRLNQEDVGNLMRTLSNWGRWGKEDQLGALNLITPAKRKQAAAEVREGVSVSLSYNTI